MWNCASIAEYLHDSKSYGFKYENLKFDWSSIKKVFDFVYYYIISSHVMNM